MTPTHALAFVNYKYYRTTDENMARFGQAFTYVSKKPRVLQLVGDGGTLWIATSFPTVGGRRYSLAYKLVDCRPLAVQDHLRRLFGDYGVIGSFKGSRHYPRNSLTDVLMSLEFVPLKPIRNRSAIGMSLMTARQLSSADVAALERYEEKLLFGKRIFISYSSRDRRRAEQLEGALLAHGQTAWRDVTSIPGGEEWERKINEALAKTDVFLLLVSENSAQSKWVRREMDTALSRYGKTGGIKRVVPVVLADSAWAAFPEMHRFQRYTWTDPAQPVPQKLIDDLKTLEQ